MNNLNQDINKYLIRDSKSLKDYILLVRNNLFSFGIVFSVVLLVMIGYLLYSENVYKSTVTMKITSQQQNVLDSKETPDLGILVIDRFISNEIEIMKNYDTREMVAKALVDSFNNSKTHNLYSIIKAEDNKGIDGHKSVREISELLENLVSVKQVSGLDLIEISAKSPSPYEAALIVNTCAEQYKELNLGGNRTQLTTIRHFLEMQSKEKLAELNQAEDTLKSFQKKGSIVALDAQSTALINQLASLDAQRDGAKVDLMTSNEVLNQYRNEVQKQDPQLADYLESQSSQAYIDVLQKQLAELQMNKDLAMANKNPNINATATIKEYEKKISELKEKLTASINEIKSGAFDTSPEQIKGLSQKLIDEKIHNHSLSIKLKELNSIIGKYEQNFRKLPETSIELAQYQRKRESLQQWYLLVEQKYQEALINELSQPGNVVIIGKGRVPDRPANPGKFLVILVGLILGLGFGFAFVLIRDYFDDTVKTPNDIEKSNINFLAWVPQFKNTGKNNSSKSEFVVLEKPDSASSEAFRALRAHIQFSRANSGYLKTILVTSPAEQEGKTFVAMNLAASFARAKKKTLLIDCDIRRPRINTVMNVKKFPGLVDYLYNRVELEDIIRSFNGNRLNYITAGTILFNPAEVLESDAMKIFLNEMKERFDIIIIDSAPIVAVVDSEILAKKVDGTILVVSADKTETSLMVDAVDLIKRNSSSFLGTVLNNFKNKKGYGYYFKYYYNYESSNNRKEKKNILKAINW